jgi:hypothetical protein
MTQIPTSINGANEGEPTTSPILFELVDTLKVDPAVLEDIENEDYAPSLLVPSSHYGRGHQEC